MIKLMLQITAEVSSCLQKTQYIFHLTWSLLYACFAWVVYGVNYSILYTCTMYYLCIHIIYV